MNSVTPTIDGLLASDALDGIRTRPLPELRELRTRCAGVESDVSMVRRLTQGRLDIVIHEAQRRSGDRLASLLLTSPTFSLTKPNCTTPPVAAQAFGLTLLARWAETWWNASRPSPPQPC